MNTSKKTSSKKSIRKTPEPAKAKADTATKHVLVLRTCAADMRSFNGFKWPTSGKVECPDWSPEPRCGNGLHGLLWGEGSESYLSWARDAKWLVVKVAESDIVDIDRKVKFPRGEVVFCGARVDATKYIADNGGAGKAIVGGTATAGDSGTATAGDRGTATAGEGGVIVIEWWDEKTGKYHKAVGIAGENGIKPNTAYIVRDGKLVEKPNAEAP